MKVILVYRKALAAYLISSAVRRAVKVKQNDAAIASVKADLTGQGGSDQ